MKDAVEDAEPLPFIAVRFLVGALVLAPFCRRARDEGPGLWRAAGWCAVALLTGYVFQTVGLQYTSSSVSAFITYLLVVIVPVIAAVTVRRPPERATTLGVAVATAGLFLLTGKGFALGRGEVLTLGCALAFAVHIILLSEFSPRFDTFRLTALQLAFVGTGALVAGFAFGGYAFPLRVWLAAVYTGVLASAAAFSLQVWGQRQAGPARTSLLLMIEPVAAAGFGYVVGDRLGWGGAAGAVLILVGIAVAELPSILTERSIS